MTTKASGDFDVKLTAQLPDETVAGAVLARKLIEKQFHGDLVATSRGQMLAAGTDVKGSAVYVAIEHVSGTLHGRSGSFVLHHRGIMTRGTPQLSVKVVPDSGTGALIGLSGQMSIVIADGKHSYEFDYAIAESP